MKLWVMVYMIFCFTMSKAKHKTIFTKHSNIDSSKTGILSRVKRGDNADPLTAEEIESVLDKFNSIRQSVDPPASNLNLVEWNEDLATLAENQAGSCLPIVSDMAIPENSSFSDLYTTSVLTPGGSSTHSEAIEDSFNNITALKEDFDYENMDCYTEKHCLNYVVAIKDSVHQIGCSLQSCDDSNFLEDPFPEASGTFLFVCVYGDLGDVINDENNTFVVPYQEGESCTECLTDFPFCNPLYTLCSNKPGNLPDRIEVLVDPGPHMNPAKEPFGIQPSIVLLDEDGNLFTSFAYPSCPWYICVVISGQTNKHGELFGKYEVPVIDGYANFSDIGITRFGDYQLSFIVSYPEDIMGESFEVENIDITIGQPLDTFGVCDVEEGDKKFERFYDWQPGCSSVCIEDCEGVNAPICSDVISCGVNADCLDDECVCKHPNDYENHPLDLNFLHETLQPELFCMPNYMEIRFDKCGMNALGFKLGELYMFGPGDEEHEIDQEKDIDDQIFPFIQSCEYNDCRGRVVSDSDGIKYSFMIQSSFLDCNGGFEYNDTYITYEHKIRGIGGTGNGVISRRRPIELDFRCTYVRRLSSTVEFFVSPFIRSVQLSIDSAGTFEMSFGLWYDAVYLQPINEPPMIEIPKPIYVGIFVKNAKVKLFVDACHATLTQNPEDTTREDLIINGESVQDFVWVTENGDSDQVQFYFESFAFKSHPDNTTLFIHCKTIVCANINEPCPTSPVERRKREAETDQVESKSVNATMTLGPITIRPSIGRKKRDVYAERYAASFSSEFSTRQLANPPFHRTVGMGEVSMAFQ